MNWDVELLWKSRENLLVFDNCTAVFEKYPSGISVSQHDIAGAANGLGNRKDFEDLLL
jgi:hypothetical protein